jgi:hypothetical protein
MPRKRPTPPPETAGDCIVGMKNLLHDIHFSGDPDIELKFALDLYLTIQTAVKTYHARVLADGTLEEIQYAEYDLQQLATIEDVLSGIKLEPAREGR